MHRTVHVRAIATGEGQVNVPLVAKINRVADENGQAVAFEMGAVSGRIMVRPDGAGFRVSNEVPGEGESLKCTCLEYRTAYDCVHMRQVVGDMKRRLNQEFLITPHRISDAVTEVNAEAATQYEESVAGQVLSREGWESGGDGVAYAGDEGAAVFQDDYAAARAIPRPGATRSRT